MKVRAAALASALVIGVVFGGCRPDAGGLPGAGGSSAGGGTTGTAGNSGGGGAPCPNVTACGGSVVGTWTVDVVVPEGER